MKKLFVLLVIFSLAFTSISEAKPSNFTLTITFGSYPGCGGIGICKFWISTASVANTGDSGSEVIEAKGDIHNNMLVIDLSKEINKRGRNEKGQFVFSVPNEMTVDQDIAKELGVEKLVISPSNYECKGNTVSFKIVSPRDPASGQASGNRLLPTVNKKDIAIDENGVHKEAAPKATYDQKVNKK